MDGSHCGEHQGEYPNDPLMSQADSGNLQVSGRPIGQTIGVEVIVKLIRGLLTACNFHAQGA